MSKIYIHEQEKIIIDTAIKMGDWLMTLTELTALQVACIKMFQSKLKCLPDVGKTADYSYGYRIESGNVKKGYNRFWCVGLSNSLDKDRTGCLEIFNHYNPTPYPETTEEFLEMVSHESHMCWLIDKPLDDVTPHSGEDWMREVNDPLQFYQVGDRLIIEIDYNNESYEVECKVTIESDNYE